MKLYAIRISYGDGCTYSAESLDMFHSDDLYLLSICDECGRVNDDSNTSFTVVGIDVASEKFTKEQIKSFKDYWI